METTDFLPPLRSISTRNFDTKVYMSNRELSQYANFMHAMAGFTFEKHDKWEVHEALKNNREELINTINGKSNKFKLIRSANYDHFFSPRKIN